MYYDLFFFYYQEENVSDVTAMVSVKYGAVPYFDGTYNLCKMNILNCPLKAGNGSTVFKYTLVQYQSIVSWTNYTSICLPRWAEPRGIR